MIGGIYSDERCSLCGGRFVDNRKDALTCPQHPDQKATRFVVKYRSITKRFKAYVLAEQFLNGLRYLTSENKLDERDYRKDNPLGFENLISKWLEVKKKEIKSTYYDNLRRYADVGISFFGNKNIKEIGYAELEDFLLMQTFSDKSKHNLISAFHAFWVWLRKRRILRPDQIPEFPTVSYEMEMRETISKEQQEAVIEEVKRLTYHLDPKIWILFKWCATYYNVRPGEMVNIKESHIDREEGIIYIPHPKEKKPKWFPLIQEDRELLEQFPTSFPQMYFFRHVKRHGVPEGKPYSKHVWQEWWNQACKNLDIEGVPFYPGTRHSTAKALRKIYSPETIKRGSGHYTTKAFSRYFDFDLEDKREIYQAGKELVKDSGQQKKAKVFKLQDKGGGRSGI
jgi:integrase